MTLKTIRHAVFDYKDGESQKMAFHGQTVDVTDQADLDRGEKIGAFFDQVGQEADRFGVLNPLPVDASDEFIKAYLAAGTAPEVLVHAGDYSSDMVAKLASLESARLHPRDNLVEGLQTLAGVKPKRGRAAKQPLKVGSAELETDELVEFVSTATVEDILARAGDDKELAQDLLDAEAADRNRKTAVDGLTAIIEK